MRATKPLQVFEHDNLSIDEERFTHQHWTAMGWYNEQHGGRFFSLTPRGVKFNQYVGVIQVGNLTIEILPKIGRISEDKSKWQKVLIDMLNACRWMKLHAHAKAALQLKPNSILEAYLLLFIQECETLLRMGLVKKYRSLEQNGHALKGKLLFCQHIQHNLIHQERFYTRHQTYDRDNVFNQILLKALRLIPTLTQSPLLKDRVHGLLLLFPDLADLQVSARTFENLVFDRKTSHYQEAMEIAALLLLNYRPDISAGRNHVLAILFDMNDLWEEYIYRKLLQHKPAHWSIQAQNSKRFWAMSNNSYTNSIKPDLVVCDQNQKVSIILDTKWKLPENNVPADADLKQMFVYNEYWEAKNAMLLYPYAENKEELLYLEGTFAGKPNGSPAHGCGILKMSVLDGQQRLDPQLGSQLTKFLEQEFKK